MSNEKIIRCKFAGDPQDEFCCNCDGIHPVDDAGNTCDAVNCGGYEPEEQIQAQPTQETPTEACEICGDSQETPKPDKIPAKGITNMIRAESGVSCEVNGRWFKFMFSEERILPEGCDIEAEKQALWDSVNAEVDAQVEAIRN